MRSSRSIICPRVVARLYQVALEGRGAPAPEAEDKDLTAQGLSLPRQMRILELSLYLGRPVGDSELDGGSYKSPAATFKRAVCN